MDYLLHYRSPLGALTLASDGLSLVGLWFDDQKYFGAGLEQACENAVLPEFELARRWLDLYFSGRIPDFTPPLSLRGTAFQVAVWETLRTIPYAHTATYGSIADRVARQMKVPRISARAVGSAVAHNPISLIVPCHRVIGADGRLTGYAGGVHRKQYLLALERADN